MKYRIFAKNDPFSKKIKTKLSKFLNHEYDLNNPDYVFAIGGDGTFLKAAHFFPDATIFGIHTGHLGFYSNFSIKNLDALIEAVNNNTFETTHFPRLDVSVNSVNDAKLFAINELTVVSPHRTLIFDVYIDNYFFEEIRATGLCISTPYGSTAYNRSLGGAIIDHELETLQLTEIAPISSNQFKSLGSPLIISKNHEIKMVSKSLYKSIFINCDTTSEEHQLLESVTVKYSDKTIKVGTLNKLSFFTRVKKSFL